MVIPVYGVADYLPNFLRSIDVQEPAGLPQEFVFVDDGSTDGSAEIIRDWISGTSTNVRLIRTANHGVSSARNTGLDEARGDWVGFLDPDDVLGDGYFAAIRSLLETDDDVDLVASNLHRVAEPDLRLRDTHQLRFRFVGGTRVVAVEGDMFVMNAASVLFPARALREHGVRFATGLHASEDALFVATYLNALSRVPRVGLAADARYGYRKRAAGSSAVDGYREDPDSYVSRFRDGYLPLLQQSAPSWLQSMVLYELQWLFPAQLDPERYALALTDDQRAAALDALAACLRHVDDERLLAYDATALPLESRLLALALAGKQLWPWLGAYARHPRRWREAADVTVYDLGDGMAEPQDRRGLLQVRSEVEWFPDYFGQRVLRARRLRTAPDVTEVRQRGGSAPVVWPRPGESTSQAQDRHRLHVLGRERQAMAAQEHESVAVAVRTVSQGPARRAASRELARARLRRGLWSKDAMTGRLFSPRGEWLIRYDPDDPDRRALDVYHQLRRLHGENVRLVGAPTGETPRGALRFGSLAHRIRRARASVILSTSTTGRPSARSRVRGIRVLLVGDDLTATDLVAIRRFAPDRLVVSDDEVKRDLMRIGVLPDDILEVSHGDTAGVVSVLNATRQSSAKAVT